MGMNSTIGENACGLYHKELAQVLKIQDARIPQEIHVLSVRFGTTKMMRASVERLMIYVRVGAMLNA